MVFSWSNFWNKVNFITPELINCPSFITHDDWCKNGQGRWIVFPMSGRMMSSFSRKFEWLIGWECLPIFMIVFEERSNYFWTIGIELVIHAGSGLVFRWSILGNDYKWLQRIQLRKLYVKYESFNKHGKVARGILNNYVIQGYMEEYCGAIIHAPTCTKLRNVMQGNEGWLQGQYEETILVSVNVMYWVVLSFIW